MSTSTPPLPPEPKAAQKPPSYKGRKSLTDQLESRARRARIIELRTANVPVETIARTVNLAPSTVRKIIEQHYKRNADWAAQTTLVRAFERERQIEWMDSQVVKILSIDPDYLTGRRPVPKGVTLTLSIRDWMSAVEASRRLKGDLIDLHGLRGPKVASDPDGGSRQPGDPVYEARIIREFLDTFKESNPALYDGLMAELLPASDPVPAELEPDLPLPGGGAFEREADE